MPQLTQVARDIKPGETHIMDVVVHLDGDREVYGWTNESHTINPRHPSWRLTGPHYRVKVTVVANEGQWEGFFWLYSEIALGGRYSIQNVARFSITETRQAECPTTATSISGASTIPADQQPATSTSRPRSGDKVC